jgi:hypothetical protein
VCFEDWKELQNNIQDAEEGNMKDRGTV